MTKIQPFIREDAPEIAVVGGGLAGLSGAYYLARCGARVHLFERKERLGGRTFAFEDPTVGVWLDNSIHIAMGCCTSLTGLMRDAGAGDRLKFLATIPFIDAAGRRSELKLNSRWNRLHPIGQMN
ncbi:MAG TPA: FAD-dependent oxidoreductase, partial [Planctomycetota bacterium]|nr:FAD-dependent oxidoreductase [Planctomycetota bacterium]